MTATDIISSLLNAGIGMIWGYGLCVLVNKRKTRKEKEAEK